WLNTRGFRHTPPRCRSEKRVQQARRRSNECDPVPEVRGLCRARRGDGRLAKRRSAVTVELTDRGLARDEVVAVAPGGTQVRVGGTATAAMERGAAAVAELVASEEPVYGVSTGFGALATTPIPAEKRVLLQKSLVRSHAAGMGPEVETEVVRAMMVLRAR